ncbi:MULTISPECIES: rod shape-determining protein MreD [unclassified Virgibacillus]|uniref:rod shape-determining protein MreD n=1 Tax=unclassified Virgibacillus TaxID=2620237 RepID=UPI0024DE79A2|nr:rod shape-determining protein MreD [Virgibacillus sp. LDC-1]
MKRLYIPLILFLLLVLEGVALDFLPTTFFHAHLMVVPHWVLLFLICVAMFYERENVHIATFYAVLFGMLIDIVYTDVLGVYMFIYGVAVYIVRSLTKYLHANFYVAILFTILIVGIADTAIYIIYTVIGITDIQWDTYVIYRLSPSIIANIIFMCLLYPLVVKRLKVE